MEVKKINKKGMIYKEIQKVYIGIIYDLQHFNYVNSYIQSTSQIMMTKLQLSYHDAHTETARL